MHASLRQAARIIKKGGVIAYPTETVYGLGCHPLDSNALLRLLQLKQRNPDKGLILISDTLERLEAYLCPLTTTEKTTLRQQHHHATTWLVPVQDWVPRLLTGQHKTLAVRITQHPLAAALCRYSGTPIVSTSANLSGKHPARNSLQVRLQFGNRLDAIVAGNTDRHANPSTIRDLQSGKIIRRS